MSEWPTQAFCYANSRAGVIGFTRQVTLFFRPAVSGMADQTEVAEGPQMEELPYGTEPINNTLRAFIRCVGDELGRDFGGDPIAPMAARARCEGWLYRELDAPHDPQLTDPVGTATALHELIAAARIEPDR